MCMEGACDWLCLFCSRIECLTSIGYNILECFWQKLSHELHDDVLKNEKIRTNLRHKWTVKERKQLKWGKQLSTFSTVKHYDVMIITQSQSVFGDPLTSLSKMCTPWTWWWGSWSTLRSTAKGSVKASSRSRSWDRLTTRPQCISHLDIE